MRQVIASTLSLFENLCLWEVFMLTSNNKVKLLCILCITTLGVFLGFKFIVPLFAPFLFAYFFAWILSPLVRFLYEKIKMPKLTSAILSLIFVGGFLVWGIGYLGNILICQLIVLLKNLPVYLNIFGSKVDSFCGAGDKLLGITSGTMKGVFDDNMANVLIVVKTKLMPSLTTRSLYLAIGIVEIVGIILVVIVTILLILKDNDKYKDSFKGLTFYDEIHIVTSKLSVTGIAYLKTQSILMALIAVICTCGLLLTKNKYALLIGIGIGVFDAFPILGSGLILVPWGIISLINRDIYTAAILLTLYLICQLIRQFLEPKLLGNRIGIQPVYTLMSMYIGFRLFGFVGFLLGPIGLIIIITIMKESKARLLGS